MLISAPGLTLTDRGLLSCFVTVWRVVWNDVCPSGALSVKGGLQSCGNGT